MNSLTDEQHRYQIHFISTLEIRLIDEPIEVIGLIAKKLESYQPGTTLAKIFYDSYRQCYGFVLFNPDFPPVELGSELPRWDPSWIPPMPPLQQQSQALEDTSIIDIELCSDEPKAPGN